MNSLLWNEKQKIDAQNIFGSTIEEHFLEHHVYSWVNVVKRDVQHLQIDPLAPTFGQVGGFDQFNIIWGANVVIYCKYEFCIVWNPN